MSDSGIEISKWLQHVFGTDFNVEIEGNTEKGDGYLGDVVFVKASNNDVVKYLVLKCGKKSKALREKAPIRDTFRNEIYIYETVIPAFKSFEREHTIYNPFNNIAKFYGSFVTDTMEVLVFENLKKRNYFLHDRKQPMSRKYIELVLKTYGHYHAISASMRDQDPGRFQKLTGNLIEIWHSFCDSCGLDRMFRGAIEESYELLKGAIPENARNHWKQFGDHIETAMNIVEKTDRFTVITHGDCWNNNFMFKGSDSNPEEVAILDWQISSHSTPIIDLSYFLFSCLHQNDLKNIHNYLKLYYDSFAQNVSQLGSDPEALYPYSQLESDWKKYSRFGVMMAALIVKISLTDKEDCKGLEDTVAEGGDIADTFKTAIKNEEEFVARIKGIVEYALDNGLIEIESCPK